MKRLKYSILFNSQMVIFISILGLLSNSCKESSIEVNPLGGTSVAIVRNVAAAAHGDQGLTMTDLATQKVIAHLLPTTPAQSMDDISISGDLLFVLDAQEDGFLTVYNISNTNNPEILQIVPAPVDPFSGVSAKGGMVMVSGGTSHVLSYEYDNGGLIKSTQSTFYRDRGHPDVAVSSGGKYGLLSTDFDGKRFGLLSLNASSSELSIAAEIEIDGAGFTGGTTTPTGFPIKSVVVDNIIYVAHGGGVTVLQLGVEGELSLVKNLTLSNESIDISYSDDTLYILSATPEPNITTLNIRNRVDPIVLSDRALKAETQPTSIAVNQDFIILTSLNSGLTILNK